MDTQEIIDNAGDITLEETAGDNDASTNFCTVWPSAKQGLEMLKEMIKNPIAKGAISVVIAAGDAVSSKVCA